MILKKIFKHNKNIYECIMDDLYYLGIRYIKETYNKMTSMKTINNEYIIHLYRTDSLYKYSTYNYLCHMRFTDILGFDKLDICFSESYAFVFIDNLYQYQEMNMKDLIISIDSATNTLVTYLIRIERFDNFSKFSIIERNNYYDSTIEILSFRLSDKEIDDFNYLIYFSYLIDIDLGPEDG